MHHFDTGKAGCGLAMIAIGNGLAHDIAHHDGGVYHVTVLSSSLVLAAVWLWGAFHA